jgi:hypothetical protein
MYLHTKFPTKKIGVKFYHFVTQHSATLIHLQKITSSNHDRPTEFIQFDVGGRIFKTSRSLIDQHEDTMLARLVSDTWQEDPNKSVFIDRNGDTFSHILDYLRYGSIDLPITISKAMFLRDLDFFGIVPEEGSVKSASEAWALKLMTGTIKSKDTVVKSKSTKIRGSGLSWRMILSS